MMKLFLKFGDKQTNQSEKTKILKALKSVYHLINKKHHSF